MLKRSILIFGLMVLLLSVVFAKSVTVIYNFPEGQGSDVEESVVLAEDANAYTAFVQAANANSIALDLVYNDAFGWYVNSINGIAGTASEYWLFWIDYIALAPTGISSYVPGNNEVIEFAYSDWPSGTSLSVSVKDTAGDAIGGADIFLNTVSIGNTNADGVLGAELTLKKDSYEIRAVKGGDVNSAAIEVVDYSPISVEINLDDPIAKALKWLAGNQDENGQIGVHAVWGNAFALMALSLYSGNDSVKQAGMDYLLANQSDDAGFGYPGFGSDSLHTAVSAMALLSNGKAVQEFAKGSTSSMDYLLSNQMADGGFGYAASDVDTTSWVAAALAQAGEAMPANNNKTPVDYLLDAQNADGGFGYDNGSASSEEYTAEALIGLNAGEYAKDASVQNAIAYLDSQQGADGCFGNSYTTSLAAIAMIGYEEDANSILGCLKGLQLDDGGFARNGTTGNSVDTGIAIIALGKNALPLSETISYDTNGSAPLYSIVKFVVPISNKGKIKATNVSVQMNGIPSDWILAESSTMGLSEIKPDETKQAVVYAKMKAVGELNIKAEISADELVKASTTNTINLVVEETVIQASLSIESITQG